MRAKAKKRQRETARKRGRQGGREGGRDRERAEVVGEADRQYVEFVQD